MTLLAMSSRSLNWMLGSPAIQRTNKAAADRSTAKSPAGSLQRGLLPCDAAGGYLLMSSTDHLHATGHAANAETRLDAAGEQRAVEQILNLILCFGFTVPGGGRCFAFSLLAGHLRLGLIMLLRKGSVPGTAHKGERFECM